MIEGKRDPEVGSADRHRRNLAYPSPLRGQREEAYGVSVNVYFTFGSSPVTKGEPPEVPHQQGVLRRVRRREKLFAGN